MSSGGMIQNPFTPEEKARILHFSSYPDWQSLAASIQLGFPSASQPLYLLEMAFNRLTPAGMASVRMDLCECEDIERQMREARKRFAVTQMGELRTNPRETDMLRKELLYWITRLMDDLGCYPNPFSMAMYGMISAMGGINGTRC